MVAYLFISFALTLAGFAQEGPRDAVVLIIRHAEKSLTGPGLSFEGAQRSEAFRRFFRKFTVDSAPLRLDAIFATADSAESQRPRLTVGPVSRANKLQIDTRFANKDVAELANELRATQSGKQVLVCWHHGSIPDLLRALGAKPETLLPDGSWPAHVYDWVIQLRYDKDGHLIPEGSKRINQNLMRGDSE